MPPEHPPTLQSCSPTLTLLGTYTIIPAPACLQRLINIIRRYPPRHTPMSTLQSQSHPLRRLNSSHSSSQPRSRDDSDEEELDPESDAAYLRRHVQSEDEDIANEDTSEHIGVGKAFRQIGAYMSKVPLFLRSSPGLGTGSYGMSAYIPGRIALTIS